MKGTKEEKTLLGKKIYTLSNISGRETSKPDVTACLSCEPRPNLHKDPGHKAFAFRARTEVSLDGYCAMQLCQMPTILLVMLTNNHFSLHFPG